MILEELELVRASGFGVATASAENIDAFFLCVTANLSSSSTPSLAVSVEADDGLAAVSMLSIASEFSKFSLRRITFFSSICSNFSFDNSFFR